MGPHYAGQRFVLGLSVGWLWTDAADLDADQLRTAEAACREAKRSGQGGQCRPACRMSSGSEGAAAQRWTTGPCAPAAHRQ
jgi:GGDEF domain-containing protein